MTVLSITVENYKMALTSDLQKKLTHKQKSLDLRAEVLKSQSDLLKTKDKLAAAREKLNDHNGRK